MFADGDIIVHRRYGPGTVLGIRKIKRDGKKSNYFCVEMADNASTLMVPEKALNEDDMRLALSDMKLIKQVLFKQPEELSDNHRARQTSLEKKLSSREPRQIVQVLRDLHWRQFSSKLTSTDTRLQQRALRSLLDELVLQPKYSLTKAQEKLDALIEQAMAHHQGRLAEAT